MLFYLFMSPNLLRLSVIQKICENWSTTAGKAKRRFDPQTQHGYYAGDNFYNEIWGTARQRDSTKKRSKFT